MIWLRRGIKAQERDGIRIQEAQKAAGCRARDMRRNWRIRLLLLVSSMRYTHQSDRLTVPGGSSMLCDLRLTSSVSFESSPVALKGTAAECSRISAAIARGIMSSSGSGSASLAILLRRLQPAPETLIDPTYLERTAIFGTLSSWSSSRPRAVRDAFSFATLTSLPLTVTVISPCLAPEAAGLMSISTTAPFSCKSRSHCGLGGAL